MTDVEYKSITGWLRGNHTPVDKIFSVNKQNSSNQGHLLCSFCLSLRGLTFWTHDPLHHLSRTGLGTIFNLDNHDKWQSSTLNEYNI